MKKWPVWIVALGTVAMMIGTTYGLPFEDCNGNGVPDDEDIKNGTSNDCNGNGIPDECEGEVLDFVFEVNLPIPDNDSNGVTDTQSIDVSNEILDVDVDVKINHTFISDLTIDVEHNATTVRLWDRQCGENENIDVIFDDEGEPVVCDSPTTGRFQPAQPLSAFDGQDLFGDWTITVADNEATNIGTLVQWSLHVTIPTVDCCVAIFQSSDTIPDAAIDAREEHAFGNPDDLTGVSSFDFTFDDSTSITPDCFVLEQTGGQDPPSIVDIDKNDNGHGITLNLDRPITAGQWTVFQYNGPDQPARTRIGFLPGDVNNSGKSTGADITDLIDCFNQQTECADFQTDMDRSGRFTSNDITRLIDILQVSNGDPMQWLNQSLPEIPPPGP